MSNNVRSYLCVDTRINLADGLTLSEAMPMLQKAGFTKTALKGLVPIDPGSPGSADVIVTKKKTWVF